jgi:hypothetical protein
VPQGKKASEVTASSTWLMKKVTSTMQVSSSGLLNDSKQRTRAMHVTTRIFIFYFWL